MSEMVERVARAIADNIQAALPDGVVVDYDYAARAAIEAMREPTEGMKERGSIVDETIDNDGIKHYDEAACLIWRAMIDEALKL